MATGDIQGIWTKLQASWNWQCCHAPPIFWKGWRHWSLVLPTLEVSYAVFSHRRYSVCISDFKCVLNVDCIARHFASFPIFDSSKTAAIYLCQRRWRWDRLLDNKYCDCALNDWIKVSLFIGKYLDCTITNSSS